MHGKVWVGWGGMVQVGWVVAYPTPIMTSTVSIDGTIYVHILDFFVKMASFCENQLF